MLRVALPGVHRCLVALACVMRGYRSACGFSFAVLGVWRAWCVWCVIGLCGWAACGVIGVRALYRCILRPRNARFAWRAWQRWPWCVSVVFLVRAVCVACVTCRAWCVRVFGAGCIGRLGRPCLRGPLVSFVAPPQRAWFSLFSRRLGRAQARLVYWRVCTVAC